MCAEHVRQLGVESPLPNLMEVKVSEAQERRRETGSEGLQNQGLEFFRGG